MPKTAEEWLEKVAAPEEPKGLLKLFLGYAPGVGKTYTMLTEAIRRHSQGQDVVVGLIETHGRPTIAELASRLEMVPRAKIEYRGTVFEEMDGEAILKRHPQVVLVDELAHTNIEGSKHRKRYEDVFDLLSAGLTVLTTMNIQHVESLTPVVRSVTGVTVRETIPDWVLQMAGDIVMIDLTPEALQNRLKRGDVYRLDKVDQALRNFFRRGNLIALREMALRQAAEHVDRSLETYMDKEGIKDSWPVRERIAVCVSSESRAQYLVARAARMARRIDADLLVVHVDVPDESDGTHQKTLEATLKLAENLGARIVRLQGNNVPIALAGFCQERHVTQVIFGRSALHGWRSFRFLQALQRFVDRAPNLDIHIVTQENE